MPAQPPAATILHKTHWKPALAALLLGVVAAIFIGKLPPALPGLRAEFGLSLSESAWMVSMFNALGVVASIFMGLFSARVGAWRLCVTGLIAMTGGAWLGVATPASMPWLLLASRFLEGVGFLSIVVSAPALLMLATADADRKRVFSFWGAYMPTGTTIGMLAAPLLIASFGWRGLWLGTSFAALAALWLLISLRGAYSRAHNSSAADSPAATWRASTGPLKKAAPWWIALAFGCYAFNFYAIMVWLPTFIVGERNTPLLTASLLTALVVAVNIGGNVMGGVLMQRGVSRGANVCLAGVFTALTCAVIFSPALPDPLRYFGCVAFSFLVGILPGSVMSSAQTHAQNPAQVGTVQGMINQGSNMGQFISPLLVTAAVSHAVSQTAGQTAGASLAWDNMLYLLLATSAIIVVSGWMIRRIEAGMAANANT